MLQLEILKNLFSAGHPVLLVDDIASETFANLIIPAEKASTTSIALMADQALGLICAAIESSHADSLGLSHMGQHLEDRTLDFTLSIEARNGVSTGISAADRAHTLQMLATTRRPELDLVMPGHIFPIRTKKGGVLVRNTAAEACVDLCQLCDFSPVAAFASVLNRSGELMTNPQEIQGFAERHGLVTVSISDIIRYRLLSEPIVEEVGRAMLPTDKAGFLTAVVIRSNNDGAEHIAMIKGSLNVPGAEMLPVPVRVHTERRIEDLLFGMGHGGRGSIEQALSLLSRLDRGLFLYIRHPRRGHLRRQAEDISFKSSGGSTMNSIREYGIGAQILHLLGVRRVILIASSTRQLAGIENFGLEIVRTFTPDQTEEISHACHNLR